MKAPVGLLSHKAVLRKQDGVASPRQTWGSPDTAPQLCHGGSGFRRSPCRGFRFSGATWLDLSNLVARTEYHSRLVLSTLILRFFSQNRCTAGISALFLHSAQRKPLCFGRKPTCYLLLFKVVLAIIITQDFVGRFSFLSTPCSRGCHNRQFKTVLPPESRHTERFFKGSLVRKR